LHQSLCICDLIPTLHLKTKIALIIHRREMKRTTNTGLLALKALVNSEMRVRGEGTEKLDLSDLLSDQYHTLLLYPASNAVNLDREFLERIDRPIQLIVPDGNWRQAGKVNLRHEELKDITRVSIATPNTSSHFMRLESKQNGMATLQAIAFALGVIEGEDVMSQLMELYNVKLKRTLASRGTRLAR
jgi:DTW domain-containing protein